LRLINNQKATELKEAFIEKALSYVGYQATGNRENLFGKRLNMNGLPWDGMFIEVTARDVGISREALPVMTYTPVALSQFLSRERVYKKPQRGDIMFFETSTDGDFGQPHVGIITNVSGNQIRTVEGMVSSGQPRRMDVNDGVHERTRHLSDALAFCRPAFSRSASVGGNDISSTVPLSLAQVRNGSRSRHVETLQLALRVATDVDGFVRGKFDDRTRLAYAKFQRQIGYPQSSATGVVDQTSLRILGEMTGVFKISD
jgi:hypothetical protein